MTDLYSRAEELRQHATYLYQAYHLTQKEIYAEKLRQLLEALIVAPPADGQLLHPTLLLATSHGVLLQPTICFIITCLLPIVLLPKN